MDWAKYCLVWKESLICFDVGAFNFKLFSEEENVEENTGYYENTFQSLWL